MSMTSSRSSGRAKIAGWRHHAPDSWRRLDFWPLSSTISPLRDGAAVLARTSRHARRDEVKPPMIASLWSKRRAQLGRKCLRPGHFPDDVVLRSSFDRMRFGDPVEQEKSNAVPVVDLSK